MHVKVFWSEFPHASALSTHPRGVLEEFHAERQTEAEVMGKRLEEELALQAASFEARNTALQVRYGVLSPQWLKPI